MQGPYLNREQSREADRVAMHDYGMSGLVLMENAGRGCVDVMERVGVDGLVVILCGAGNNAGDGFVIARHLDLRGYECRVVLTSMPRKLPPDAKANLDILLKTDVRLIDTNIWHADMRLRQLDGLAGGADWVVDALLGTGAKGRPRPPLDALIDWINAEDAKTLAVDLPSGLDCDTGEPASPCVRADHTCTFVAPKVGFRAASARDYLGEVHVVDIGAPRGVIDRACALAK